MATKHNQPLDMATVRALTDPVRRRAELHRALADAERPTPPGFFVNYDAAKNDVAEAPRVSEPSPWAKGGTGGLDKAALPSAMAPEGGVEKEAPAAPPARARRLAGKHVAVAVALGVAVAAVAVAMPMLVQRGPKVPAEATTAHDAASGATATQGAAAMPVPTPGVPAAPSAAATAAPKAKPSGEATAAPRAPVLRPTKPRGTGDDPYDGATAAPPRTEPPPPAEPPPTPPSPPPAKTPAEPSLLQPEIKF